VALQLPTDFPDRYWLPVLAAEAAARASLLAALSGIPWQHGPSRYLHWDDVKKAVGGYLTSVVGAFAGQACLAVRAREYPAIRLDHTVEHFMEIALHQAYWGIDHEKIKATWSGRTPDAMGQDMRPIIRAGAWHAQYLLELPDVLQAASASSTGSDPHSAKEKGRSAVVAPLLASKGWSASQWANAAGVSPTIAYDYLSGKTDPRPESRKALAEALGLNVPDLPA
jgi:hypothetical protein